MKRLVLIRHGKSSWEFAGTPDERRPLNDRGERDAPRMAEALARRGVVPDLVVSSPAVRALSTARLVAEGLDFPPGDIACEESLYLATEEEILHAVQGLDEGAGTALLFGHNPGMHEAVNRIAADAGVADFPTLAAALLELDVEHWGEAEFGCGRLMELLTPRSVAQAG